jgi:hypothetical protein
MNDTTMMSQYIYLLQEREFIKTKENIYKVGMTKKENHKRFDQYPKGSVLLFQMICNNCKNIERQIIKLFKEKFTRRTDIGNEYFEGDYKVMIDYIYSTIKDENGECENVKITNSKEESEENYKDDDDEESNENEDANQVAKSTYQITTYEEWIKYSKIRGIVITKKTGEGFLRLEGGLWRVLYDKTRFDYDEDIMEDLFGFIERYQPEVMKMIRPNNVLVSWSEMMDSNHTYKNEETDEIIPWERFRTLNETEQKCYTYISKQNKYTFIDVEYDVNKIFQDVIKKCYVKNYDVYDLKYHEFVFPGYQLNAHYIFNSVNCTFTPVDELINNKILTKKGDGIRQVIVKNIIHINIVDDILSSLVASEIILQYKKLVYNLIVKQEEEQIIFYDYNDCLLTTWVKDLLYSISSAKCCVNSFCYYDDKSEFKKMLKTHKPRCVIIHDYKSVSVKTQIKDFCNLGFKNIIVCQNVKMNTMYNISNFRKYLNDNEEQLIDCIKEEHNYEPIRSWKTEVCYDDDIFYGTRLLFTNFLKWCCIK